MEEEVEKLPIIPETVSDDIEEVEVEEIPGTGGIIGGNLFGNIRIQINGQDIFM
jgi:hypothetical protein